MSHYKLLTGFVFVNLVGAGLAALVLRPVDKKPLPVLKGHHYWANHVAFSPDGKVLASAAGMLDRAGEVTLWDMVSGEAKLHLELTPGTVYAVAFSPDGALLATAHEDDMVRLWDTTNGRQVRTLSGHTDRVCAVLFSPDGKSLASNSRDYSVRLWDLASGRQRWVASGFGQMAFSRDNQLLLAGGGPRGTIRIWDVATGREKAPLEGCSMWVL
ncbi:MAG TPA: hypothetical protein VKI17_01070, partial [Gemmataceae bacterium]|nr:hypothetical protein [Gemmataceae bacterium]